MRIQHICVIATLIIFSCKDKQSLTLHDGLYIENVTILTPKNNYYTSEIGNIVIDNDQIINISTDQIDLEGNFTSIDATGKFVIPGLIDSHVHLASIAGLNWKHKREYPELVKSYFNQLPKSYLYFGYTTLIDVNNYNPKVVSGILDAKVRPDIYTCGDQMVIPHGLMMNETPKEARLLEHPNFLHDPYNANVSIPDTIDTSQNTPKALINRLVNESDGICVKTLYEDGFGGTEDLTWELPSKKIIEDVITEAHKQNIPVLLHANAYEAQKFGLETGVDIMAHGMWHWGDLEEYINVDELPETHKTLLLEIAKQQIGYQPTIRVVAGQKDVFDESFLDNPDLVHVLPDAFASWLHTEEGKWQQTNIKKYAKELLDGLSNEEIMELMQKVVSKVEIATSFLAENDANLIFGTDTPAANTYTMPPGLNGYLEMHKWHEIGVSLEQILLAATINNARAFNLEDQYGSIEVGKTANLVLLKENPLKSIEAYNSINNIIVRGQLLERADLSAAQ